MITEKVSPNHPDKIADRIAGALVDYCYKQAAYPRCAFEVMLGHGICTIQAETDISIPFSYIEKTVNRICGKGKIYNILYYDVPQDQKLCSNQSGGIKCGDNGIFCGFPMPKVHKDATDLCKKLYKKLPYDGKILVNDVVPNSPVICWSNSKSKRIKTVSGCKYPVINPIGEWTGGPDVDTGVTGRKLASDFYGMTHPLGGGNMHGKDLSKADVSVNIYCAIKAQDSGFPVYASCAIGSGTVLVNDTEVSFEHIVDVARKAIDSIGGFEKFAEWGLSTLV